MFFSNIKVTNTTMKIPHSPFGKLLKRYCRNADCFKRKAQLACMQLFKFYCQAEAVAELNVRMWKSSDDRKPLVLKGARQVGKTWIMKEFGRNCYESFVYFDFDEDFEKWSNYQHPTVSRKKNKGLDIKQGAVALMRQPLVTETVGFEPTCPCGQPHFECGSLRPLRYISKTSTISLYLIFHEM